MFYGAIESNGRHNLHDLFLHFRSPLDVEAYILSILQRNPASMSSHGHDRGKGSGPPQSPVIPGAVPDVVENTMETPAASTSTSSNNHITGSSSSLADPSFLRRPSFKSSGTSEGCAQGVAAVEASGSGPGRDDDGGLDDSNKGLSTGVAAVSATNINRGGLSLRLDAPIKGKSTQGIRESGIRSGSGIGVKYVESDGRRSNHPSTPAPCVGGEKGKMVRGDGPVSSGTFMYQSQLPKLQVPPLEDTLSRYLLAVQPLLSPEAFLRTKAVVEEVSEYLIFIFRRSNV